MTLSCEGCGSFSGDPWICHHVNCIRHPAIADNYKPCKTIKPELPERIDAYQVSSLKDPEGIGMIVKRINDLIDYLKAREEK